MPKKREGVVYRSEKAGRKAQTFTRIPDE